MCTVIFFGILLYFTTISGKNIHNNKNVENENPKQIRLHYNNAMDSRSIMCSFGNGRLGNQVIFRCFLITETKKVTQVLPRFELGSLDSKSRVLTITP